MNSSDQTTQDSTDRVNDRLERGFLEVRQDIRDLASKFDSKVEKQDDRIRLLEIRIGQIVLLGFLATFIIAPLIGLALRKMGL